MVSFRCTDELSSRGVWGGSHMGCDVGHLQWATGLQLFNSSTLPPSGHVDVQGKSGGHAGPAEDYFYNSERCR